MHTKKIAISADTAKIKGQKYLKNQTGLTLIELMVALALGLLVVGVATTAMLGTRNVTSSVSDVSGIQQQAAYVMRVFGTQLRQAGSLYLDLGLDAATGTGDIEANTAFQLRGSTASSISENSGTVTIRFTGYEEPTFINQGPISRNCLGVPGTITAGETVTIESIFTLNGNNLRCQGNGANVQPIAQNVANFQVRYLLQSNDAANPTMLYTNAAGVGNNNWSRVQGVEVCLVLFGNNAIDLPAGTSYTDCDGTAVNMTTLAGARRNRMHYVFRNVFQLRSQGLI